MQVWLVWLSEWPPELGPRHAKRRPEPGSLGTLGLSVSHGPGLDGAVFCMGNDPISI
jgi:hypothetical protein